MAGSEMIEIKLERVDRTYRPGEAITGILQLSPTTLLKV
jgi:hypothetical protein